MCNTRIMGKCIHAMLVASAIHNLPLKATCQRKAPAMKSVRGRFPRGVVEGSVPPALRKYQKTTVSLSQTMIRTRKIASSSQAKKLPMKVNTTSMGGMRWVGTAASCFTVPTGLVMRTTHMEQSGKASQTIRTILFC